MTDQQQKVSFASGGLPLPLLQLFVSLIVTVVVAYGAGRFASGQNDAQIQELQRLATANKAEIDYLRSNTVSQAQMTLLIQMVRDVRDDQGEIKKELSALRRGQ